MVPSQCLFGGFVKMDSLKILWFHLVYVGEPSVCEEIDLFHVISYHFVMLIFHCFVVEMWKEIHFLLYIVVDV